MTRHLLQKHPWDLRKGEGIPLALSMGFAFFSIASVVIGKSLSDALLLSTCSLEKLPLFFICTSLACMVVALIQFALVRIVRPLKLNTTLIALFTLSSLYMKYYSNSSNNVVIFSISIALIVFPSLLNILCWNAISDYFDLRQGRRLFPAICAASTAGGFTAGLLLPPLIHTWGIEQLFHAEAAAFLLTLPSAIILSKKRKSEKNQLSFSDEQYPSLAQNLRNGIQDFWKNPLLRILAAVVFLGAISTNLIDYNLKESLKNTYNRQEIGLFYGYFNAITNFVNLCFQIFVASSILKRFQLGTLFLMIPIALLILTIPTLVLPTFGGIVLLRWLDQALRFNLQDPARETAMAPIAFFERNRAKVFIKGFMNPLGAICAGVLLYAIQFVTDVPTNITLLALSLVLILWSLCLRKFNTIYSNCLYQSILLPTDNRITTEKNSDSAPNNGLLNITSNADFIEENLDKLEKQLQEQLHDNNPDLRACALEQYLEFLSQLKINKMERMNASHTSFQNSISDLLKKEWMLAMASIAIQNKIYEEIDDKTRNTSTFVRASDEIFNYYISVIYRILLIFIIITDSPHLKPAIEALISPHHRMRAQALDLLETSLKKYPKYSQLTILIEDIPMKIRWEQLQNKCAFKINDFDYYELLSKENNQNLQNALVLFTK